MTTTEKSIAMEVLELQRDDIRFAAERRRILAAREDERWTREAADDDARCAFNRAGAVSFDDCNRHRKVVEELHGRQTAALEAIAQALTALARRET